MPTGPSTARHRPPSNPDSFGFVVGSQMSFGERLGPGRLAGRDRRPHGDRRLRVEPARGFWRMGHRRSRSTGARQADRTLTIGTAWSLRVRARDGAGNWGAWTSGRTITPKRYQESSPRVSYHGTWRVVATSSASGGHQRYATRKGASVTFRFTGRAFGIVAPKGASRGSAKMYVDGVYVSTVSLYRSSWRPRNVVAARSWSSSGSHTVKLVVVGTAGHPRVDVDAFLVIP